jgi:hypothetical protein
MVSDQRYFERRAFQESSRAARALTHEAREWHEELAKKFKQLASGNCANEGQMA